MGWRAGLAAAAALMLVYGALVLTLPGQRADATLFGWAQWLGVGPLDPAIPFVGRRVLPAMGVVLVVWLGVTALRRGDVMPVVRAALVVLVATGISPLLRDHLLVRPDLGAGGYVANTFPSTHASLVLALVAAALILVGDPTPRLVQVAAAVAAFTMVANVVGHAHRPSDALGSLLLVLTVWGLASGPRPLWGPRPGDHTTEDQTRA